MTNSLKIKSIDSEFPRKMVVLGVDGEPIDLVECEPGIFKNPLTGTIFALPDKGSMTDTVTRCGVGVLSLPEDHDFTSGCAAHDAAYSIPAYQKYNERSRADDMLYTHLRLLGANKVQAWCMTTVARIFGGRFWENKLTR